MSNSVRRAAPVESWVGQPARYGCIAVLRLPTSPAIRAALTERLAFLQMYTDAQFKAPHARELQLLSARTSQLFAYRFDQPGPDLVGSGYPGT